MVEFALLQMLLMCGPHFRSDVIVQPRYFAEVTFSSECPWRVQLNFIGFLIFVIVRTLHFSGWNAINHDVSHFC